MRTGVAGFQSERLKQLRLAFGMTQTTLAEMVGRASGNVSKWENGLQVPEADAFQRLCEVFGVSENWLLEEQFTPDANTPFFLPITAQYNYQRSGNRGGTLGVASRDLLQTSRKP